MRDQTSILNRNLKMAILADVTSSLSLFGSMAAYRKFEDYVQDAIAEDLLLLLRYGLEWDLHWKMGTDMERVR